MIKLENVTLRVKQIRGGRYGDFCVGELFHQCCELKVKDSLLDQFEEGEYHGTVNRTGFRGGSTPERIES